MVEPKSDSERLYEDTRSIYEMFTPLKLKPLRNLTCDRAAAAQFVFSTAVRTGWETHGVELDEPAYTYLDFATLRSQKAKLSSGKEDGRGLKEGGQSSSSTRRNSDGQKMHAPKLPPRKAPPPYKDSTPTIRNAPPPSRNAEDKASRETEYAHAVYISC